MPDYRGATNYAYHLDAGKFAALLAAHAVQRLGVRHISDHVVGVTRDDDRAGSRRSRRARAAILRATCSSIAAGMRRC